MLVEGIDMANMREATNVENYCLVIACCYHLRNVVVPSDSMCHGTCKLSGVAGSSLTSSLHVEAPALDHGAWLSSGWAPPRVLLESEVDAGHGPCGIFHLQVTFSLHSMSAPYKTPS